MSLVITLSSEFRRFGATGSVAKDPDGISQQQYASDLDRNGNGQRIEDDASASARAVLAQFKVLARSAGEGG